VTPAADDDDVAAVETSLDAATVADDSGTVTVPRPLLSRATTSFMASTGSSRIPQPAGSHVGRTTDPETLTLLLRSAGDAATTPVAARHSHTQHFVINPSTYVSM